MGAITLKDLRGRIAMLSVVCDRCGRQGRLQVPALIERHGPDMAMPDLAWHLAGDCPKRHGLSLNRCSVHFPELGDLFLATGPDEG